MPIPRTHVLFVGLILVIAGCSDGPAKKGDSSSPARNISPTLSASPGPSYTALKLKSFLLTAGDISSKVTRQPVNIPGLKQRQIAICSVTPVTLPGDPQLVTHQFGNPDSRYTGANYFQRVAIYTDAASAMKAFQTVQARIRKCPAKHHVPAKPVAGTKAVLLEHDDTWKSTSDVLRGWTHTNGFEKHVEPPSSSIINVFYISYDYAVRGNVLLTSFYYERVKPSAAGAPIARRSSAVLAKQLTKIGE